MEAAQTLMWARAHRLSRAGLEPGSGRRGRARPGPFAARL